jgi:glutathione S-transferase
VPSLKYGDEIITESAIVAGFLADAYPSHLVPATTDPGAALKRARIAFFADTFSTKLNGPFFKSVMSGSEEERDASLKQYVEHVAKEIEPLLSDAAPFFGGSDKLTLAEVRQCSQSSRAHTHYNNTVQRANRPPAGSYGSVCAQVDEPAQVRCTSSKPSHRS